MKPEITYLVWVTILTALMWIPYVLDRMTTWGLTDTVGYPEAPKLQSPWARRMKSAHANAVENLVIFATLVLAANALASATARPCSRAKSACANEQGPRSRVSGRRGKLVHGPRDRRGA